MKKYRLNSRLTKSLLFSSLGFAVLTIGMSARGRWVELAIAKTYDGISCDNLMEVYKGAYAVAGFQFKSKEAQSPNVFLLTFDFPNHKEPNKPPGGGGYCSIFRKIKKKRIATLKNITWVFLDIMTHIPLKITRHLRGQFSLHVTELRRWSGKD